MGHIKMTFPKNDILLVRETFIPQYSDPHRSRPVHIWKSGSATRNLACHDNFLFHHRSEKAQLVMGDVPALLIPLCERTDQGGVVLKE